MQWGSREGSQEHKMLKSGDHYLALLAYRSTPLECGFSSAQLLTSRNVRTILPMIREQRVLRVVNLLDLEKDHHIKEQQRKNATELRNCYYARAR